MHSPFKTESFKRLHAKWMKKLEKKNFQDIENERGDLKDHKSIGDLNQRIHFKYGIKELTISYYDWANEMLHVAKFKSGRDKKIWRLHAAGKTGSEISKVIGLERTWVNRKIQKIAKYLKAF